MGRIIEFRPPEPGYQLVLAFDSDDPEFTRGFEAGRVYEALKPHTASQHEFQVHDTNLMMMERIAQATGYAMAVVNEPCEGWAVVRFLWRPMA